MKKALFIFCCLLLSNIVFAQSVLKIPASKTKPAIDCPSEGKPKEGSKKKFYEERNRLKNRYKNPAINSFDKRVTLENMIGDGEADSDKFDENKAATIEGYIVYVSPSPWAETCNCGTVLSDYTDIHIEIADNPDEEKGGRTVVVELTPRIRLKKSQEWSRKELKKLWQEKTYVRISGWLFYDKEHEPQARNIVGEDCEEKNNRRQTCWEIHPITEIEVVEEIELNKANTLSFTESGSMPLIKNDPDSLRSQELRAIRKEIATINNKNILSNLLPLGAAVLGALMLWIGQYIERSSKRKVEQRKELLDIFEKCETLLMNIKSALNELATHQCLREYYWYCYESEHIELGSHERQEYENIYLKKHYLESDAIISANFKLNSLIADYYGCVSKFVMIAKADIYYKSINFVMQNVKLEDAKVIDLTLDNDEALIQYEKNTAELSKKHQNAYAQFDDLNEELKQILSNQ